MIKPAGTVFVYLAPLQVPNSNIPLLSFSHHTFLDQ